MAEAARKRKELEKSANGGSYVKPPQLRPVEDIAPKAQPAAVTPPKPAVGYVKPQELRPKEEIAPKTQPGAPMPRPTAAPPPGGPMPTPTQPAVVQPPKPVTPGYVKPLALRPTEDIEPTVTPPQKVTWLDKFKQGGLDGIVGGITGLLGSAVAAPQSIYLNAMYNLAATAQGGPHYWVQNMNGKDYTDMTAQLAGKKQGVISDAYDKNPLLGAAADIVYNAGTDPLTVALSFAGAKAAKGVQAAGREATKKLPDEAFKGVDPESVRHGVTSPQSAQSVVNGIDVRFFREGQRFDKGFYVTQQGETAVNELAAHDAKATHVIRFTMDTLGKKVLNLADKRIAQQWNFTGSSNYTECQAIASRARAMGYDVIAYPSFQGSGVNYIIYDDFAKILRPKMVSPVK